MSCQEPGMKGNVTLFMSLFDMKEKHCYTPSFGTTMYSTEVHDYCSHSPKNVAYKNKLSLHERQNLIGNVMFVTQCSQYTYSECRVIKRLHI